jgi:hypothetical protein
MTERAQATRIAGYGPDVHGWYSISFTEVAGLKSGDRRLQVIIPSDLALDLAEAVQKQLRQPPPGTP